MNILYATDGSAGSYEAALFLAALKHQNDLRIHILTVPGSAREEDLKAAHVALTQAKVPLFTFASAVTTEVSAPAVSNNEITQRIVERAAALQTDLLVLGTHGRTALERWFIGSVALNVVRHAPCPVLIARTPRGELDRILVGVDGSSCAENAVEWMVGNLPLPDSCAVRLMGVVALPSIAWEEPMPGGALAQDVKLILDQEQTRLQEALSYLSKKAQAPSRTVITDTLVGSAAGGLVETAKDWNADLVTLGSHGLTGLDRWLLGSVSEGVLQRCPCSILVVREPHEPAIQDEAVALT